MANLGVVIDTSRSGQRVDLSHVVSSSFSIEMTRDNTFSIPSLVLQFDYALGIGDITPLWAEAGTKIRVWDWNTNKVLFLGRLEIPGVTMQKRGRATMRVRAVSDLDNWAKIVRNRRSQSGMGVVTTGSAARTYWLAFLNDFDSGDSITVSGGNVPTSSTYYQSGTYWAEGATYGDLLARFGYSFKAPHLNTYFSGSGLSSIENTSYQVMKSGSPYVGSDGNDYFGITTNNALISGEWRATYGQFYNSADIGYFQGAINIGSRTQNSRESSVRHGNIREYTSAVGNYGRREIQMPTFWQDALSSDGSTNPSNWDALETELARAVIDSVPKTILLPDEITVDRVPAEKLTYFLPGGRLCFYGRIEGNAVDIGAIFGSAISFTATPHPTIDNTFRVKVSMVPFNETAWGGDTVWNEMYLRWVDYDNSWNWV